MEIEVGSARVEEEGAGRVEDCKNLGQLRFSAINSAELLVSAFASSSMTDQAALESTHLRVKIPQATMDFDDEIGGSEDLV
jgi:hypothetical protein